MRCHIVVAFRVITDAFLIMRRIWYTFGVATFANSQQGRANCEETRLWVMLACIGAIVFCSSVCAVLHEFHGMPNSFGALSVSGFESKIAFFRCHCCAIFANHILDGGLPQGTQKFCLVSQHGTAPWNGGFKGFDVTRALRGLILFCTPGLHCVLQMTSQGLCCDSDSP